jgi:uncharacterized protein
MITKEDLINYSKKKNYNLGQAEKDYFQEIILFILYSKFNNNLVFKGGTALTKCYGFDRFSEDLDFNGEEKEYKTIIEKGLKDFYLDFEIEEKKHQNSINLTIKLNGPLYNGNKNSKCKIEIDINLKEKSILKTNLKKIGLFIEQIPSFEIIVLSEEEILAEKIRTIIERNKARDIYDLYYLIKKNTKINYELIKLKIKKDFNKNEFLEKLKEKEIIWDSELKSIVKNYPLFKEVNKYIKSKI